jgi:leader peptidase (prepilin peptidase)/N-methyltransferase
VLGEQIFKKEAIGLGDVKLIGAIGTICGIKGCAGAIFGGSAIGILIILPILAKRFFVPREGGDISVLLFAPFLSLGTILFILFGRSAFLGHINDYAQLALPWR